MNWGVTNLIKKNPGKKLYFSYESIDVSNQIGNIVQLTIMYNDGTATSYNALLTYNLTNNLYTIPNDTSNISYAQFIIYSNNSNNNTDDYSVTIVKPQLQFGETALPYSEYGTPQEKELDLESYNKLNYDNNTNLENYYYNENGVRTESVNTAYINQKITNIKASTTYYLSFKQRVSTPTVRLCEYTSNGTFIQRTLITSKQTITTNSNTSYIIASTDKKSSSYFEELQLSEGSIEKPYQAYYHYELYENGYFSRENGKWFLNNEWGKYIFNNDLTQNGIDTNSVKLLTPALNIEANLTPIQLGNYTYSNLFSKSIAMENYTGLNGTTSSKKIRISLGLEYVTTYAEAYQKLANLIIVYPLETTSKIEITNQTLINQLNDIYKLMSYDGTTIIETECEEGNLPILVSASALKGE